MKNNIIDEWLSKKGDPAVTKKIEEKLKKIEEQKLIKK
tara:strand:+ start:347 stop:460 length:114 start_codon:yes stop_codon:yes gene_type:complete